MYRQVSLTRSASTSELPNSYLQVERPQTPGPEDRLSYSFKSLFTLADVAAKRRSTGGLKKRTYKKDENAVIIRGSMGSTSMRRSKSSGDLAVLVEMSNTEREAGENVSSSESIKAFRLQTATTLPSAPPKIPKATSLHSQTVDGSSDVSGCDAVCSTSSNLAEVDALSIDNTYFVLVTPPRQSSRLLTLAAHAPSLPPVASPLSPRTSKSRALQPLYARPARSCPGTGHTTQSLLLTKSHWELRYENWMRSLRLQHTPISADMASPNPKRSRFPPPLTNPALFPRAGSLTPTALRPVLDGTVSGEDARPAIEVDWAMRSWPLDKIQRTLFLHDIGTRTCDSIKDRDASHNTSDAQGHDDEAGLDLTRLASAQTGEDNKQEDIFSPPRWEWDWELRWRTIEGLAGNVSERTECDLEYGLFPMDDEKGDRAYGGCELAGGFKLGTAADEDWEWSEDAMEVDANL